MSFLDKLFLSGVAAALKTPTGQIDVSASTPVAGRVLKVVDPTHATWQDEAGGGASADTTVVNLLDTLSPAVDHIYYCAIKCTVTMPDATIAGNIGKRITIHFQAGRNLIRGESLESPNYFVDRTGQATTELSNMPAGAYVFEAVYDSGTYPVGFWAMQQVAQVETGKVSVDWCYPGELPIYTVVPVGTGDRYQLEGTGDSPGKLELDGTGNYAPGQTLIVPFDTGDIARVAVFRVVNNDAPDDWQLESVYLFPTAEKLPNGNELEYQVVYGDQWGGRRFRTNVKGNAYLPSYYVLQREPLECWPPDELLDGTGSGSHSPHLGNVLLAGRNNMVQLTGNHTVTLLCPSTNFMKGERFAITVADAHSSTRTWTVDVSGTDALGISDAFGNVLGTSAVVTLKIGTYIEWQLGPDERWHVVSFIEGTDPS
jgi:hypothetical protein